MSTQSTMQNPTKQYKPLDIPRQSQPEPGLDSKLKPHADHGEQTYKGSGRLTGRKALITGGDSGIGRAVAIAYAREGVATRIENRKPLRIGLYRDVVWEAPGDQGFRCSTRLAFKLAMRTGKVDEETGKPDLETRYASMRKKVDKKGKPRLFLLPPAAYTEPNPSADNCREEDNHKSATTKAIVRIIRGRPFLKVNYCQEEAKLVQPKTEKVPLGY